jgi:cell division septation protein DedD
MDVAAYIKELLDREHLVYVPGLGTFSKHKIASIYNSGQHQFYPPKNSIDFAEGEKQDDMLEKHIVRQKNISPQAAGYFIQKLVDQLKNDSALKNIPVKEALFPVENEKTDASFNRENFGLPPVKLSALKKEADFTSQEAVTKKDYTEDPYRDFSNNLPEEEAIEPKKSIGFWAALFLLLAVCLLGCYALYLYYPDIYSRFIPKKQAAVVLQKPVVDSAKHLPATQKQISNDTAKAKVVADTPASAVKNIAPALRPAAKDTAATALSADPDLVAKSPYEIIGAAFKTLKGAKIFLSRLKSKGMHRAKILKNTSGKAVLITFGSFQDKETAHAALEKLRAKDVHSEAYIQHYLK